MQNPQANSTNHASGIRQPSMVRAVFAGILGVIAMLFFLPAVLSLWVNLVILNPDSFSKTATAVIVEPKVSKQIANSLADSIVTDDTLADLQQSLLPPEKANLAPEEAKAELNKIFSESLSQIIATPAVKNSAIELLKKSHTILIVSPPKGATTATLDFRPFIAAVINGAKGTKISIITDKFTLSADQGVLTIDQNQYGTLQSVVNGARTSLAIQLGIFLVGSLLAIIIANRRLRALKRILLSCGILLVILGLPLYLIPMLLSSSTQADIAATFAGVSIVLNSLGLTALIAGIVLIVLIIIANIITKITSKNAPSGATENKPSVKTSPGPSKKESKSTKAKPKS